MAETSRRVITEEGPSPLEVEHNESLEEWCKTRVEPVEESDRRRNVLSRLQHITKLWIRSIMISEFRMSAEAANAVDGRLFTTGSYRYNVHTSGSDIDMVLIAPDRVTREHFFSSLVERFRAEPWITQLDCIKDARVPIIAMKADGVDIDLSFGSIRRSNVPEVISDDLLRGLDESSVRSCNAVRVASSIIEMVPNKVAFRQALRFIKAWGKERGIYNLKLGFPSGIGWAILVAKSCQMCPNKNAAGVLCRFFRVYAEWFRPDARATGRPNRAIFLTDSLTPSVNLGPCWDPRNNARDGDALFPVITPANPYSNACYNVSVTTLRILCKEFARGNEILSRHLSTPQADAVAQFGPFGVWKHVLEPYPFFSSHTNFLWVRVSCTDVHKYAPYVDSVEVKIPLLWAENPYTRGIALEAFPNVEVRVVSSRFEDADELRMREAIIKSEKTGAPLDVTVPPSQVFTTHFVFGLDAKPTPAGQPAPKVDLTRIVVAFLEQVKGLTQYKPPFTKLPTVEVVKVDQLPRWMTGLNPKRERNGDAVAPPPTEGTANAAGSTAAAAAAATTTTTQEGTKAPAVKAPIAPLPSLRSAGASSALEPSAKPVTASRVPIGAASSAGPAAQPASSASALDEALGMDF